MGQIKYKLKGHESFVPREGWFTKGLRAVNENSSVFFKNRGADALGVGTNMAMSIRYWMRTAGLCNGTQKGEYLTDLGAILLENDPYFEDVFSIALLHANIASNFESATSWSLFYNDLSVTSAFTRDELFSMLKNLLIEKTGETDPTERSLRDDCAAILSMYCLQETQNDDPEEKRISPFTELALIARAGNKYIKKRPYRDLIHPSLILYLIIDELNEKGSLQIDHITDGCNMPGKIFNLNRITVNDHLDALQNKKQIIVNRTAGLDIVYPDCCRDKTKETVIKEYYEGKKNATV